VDRHVVDVTAARPDADVHVLHQPGQDVLHLVKRSSARVSAVRELPRVGEVYEPDQRVDLREDH